MAIDDPQKVDFLLKKVAYEIGKTAQAASKDPSNETLSSPLVVHGRNVWIQSVPNSTGITVPYINRHFIQLIPDTPRTTNGYIPTWTANNSGNWISTAYGLDYSPNFYIGATGITNSADGTLTKITPVGSGDSDAFFFDYSAGIVHFAENNVPSRLRTTSSNIAVYVQAFRYTGATAGNVTGSGAVVAQSGASLSTITVTGTSNFDTINANVLNIGSLIEDPNQSPSTVSMWNLDIVAGNELKLRAKRNDLTIKTEGDTYPPSNSPPSGGAITISAHSGINLIARNNNNILISGNNINISGSAKFNNTPTVNNTAVSLSGHQHTYQDITNFCTGVATCVDTALLASTGIQFVSGTKTLALALSGQALNIHNLANNGLVVRTGTTTGGMGSFVNRSLVNGSNIIIDNGDAVTNNPVIRLNTSLTGLIDLTVDRIKLDNDTISTTGDNTNLILDPHGNGQIHLDADIVRINNKIITKANNNLVLSTFSDQSNIIISSGNNGNISLNTSGNGEVAINKVNISSGSINNTTIGLNTAADAKFTNISGTTLSITTSGAIGNISFNNNTINNSTNNLIINGSNRIGLRNTSPEYDVDISGNLRVTDNLYVNKDLIIDGDTVIANVSTLQIQDPSIRLGSTSGNAAVIDTLDRGVEFVYATGGSPAVQITGFFGWRNDSDGLIGKRRFIFAEKVEGTGSGGVGDYAAVTLGTIQAGHVNASLGEFTDINGKNIALTGEFKVTGSESSGLFTNIYANKIRANTYEGASNLIIENVVLENSIADRLQLSGVFNNANGSGQLYLNGLSGNYIQYNNNGLGAPLINSTSTGTKILLNRQQSSTFTNYAIGMENNAMWHSLPSNTSTYSFKWYGGVSQIASLNGLGLLSVSGLVVSSGTNVDPSISFVNDSDTGLYSPAVNSIAISTSGQQRLVVTPSGSIGIGITNPAYGLHFVSPVTGVADGFRLAQNLSSRYLQLTNGGLLTNTTFTIGSTTDDSTSQLYVNTNSAARIGLTVQGVSSQTADLISVLSSTNTKLFSVNSGGNVGIGSTSPTSTLHVVGSGYFTQGVYATGFNITGVNSNNLLTAGGSHVSVSSLNVNSAVHISGGSTGAIPFQTASSNTSFNSSNLITWNNTDNRLAINTAYNSASGHLHVSGTGYITTLIGTNWKTAAVGTYNGPFLLTSSISGIYDTTYLENFIIDGGSP